MILPEQQKNSLEAAQSAIWRLIFQHEKTLELDGLILGDGTALSRFFLHHRVSYDLDFFIPQAFSPDRLLSALKQTGLTMTNLSVEDRPAFSRQLSGDLNMDGVPVKVDFIEDIYAGMFNSVTMRDNQARSECVEGLYHRKIRTISGTYHQDGGIVGARQSARDIFDLFVLNARVKPLSDFVPEINRHGADVPEEGLYQGLLNLPWEKMQHEFEDLERTPDWQSASLAEIREAIDNEATRLIKKTYDNPAFQP